MADSITIQNNNIMPLVDDLRQIINQTRNRVGKQIVSAVSTQLQSEYGDKGFEPRTIRRMMQFASMFPDIKIVTPLVTQLS